MVDHHDGDDLDVELDRRSACRAGVLTARLVPQPGQWRDFVPDVLTALGKSSDCLEREHQTSRAWLLTSLWLRAEGVRHLVVPHADRVAVIVWSELEELARDANATLWLIVGASFRTANAQLFGVQCSFLDVATMLRRLPGPTAVSPAPVLEPPLPTDDFLTFRASCRRLLTPERFAVLDACYRSAFEHAASFDWAGEGRVCVDEDAIVDALQRVTATAASTTETLVRMRAAQAAFFRAGILVRLVQPTSRKGMVPAVGLTEHSASRLRRLISTDITAAAALGLACPQLARTRLSVGDLDPATHSPHPGLGALPPYGRSLVEAYRLERLAAGASAPDPFFVTAAGTPANAVHVKHKADKALQLAAIGPSAHDYGGWGSRRGRARGWSIELPSPQPRRF